MGSHKDGKDNFTRLADQLPGNRECRPDSTVGVHEDTGDNLICLASYFLGIL
jgi:hypothetical protein